MSDPISGAAMFLYVIKTDRGLPFDEAMEHLVARQAAQDMDLTAARGIARDCPNPEEDTYRKADDESIDDAEPTGARNDGGSNEDKGEGVASRDPKMVYLDVEKEEPENFAARQAKDKRHDATMSDDDLMSRAHASSHDDTRERQNDALPLEIQELRGQLSTKKRQLEGMRDGMDMDTTSRKKRSDLFLPALKEINRDAPERGLKTEEAQSNDIFLAEKSRIEGNGRPEEETVNIDGHKNEPDMREAEEIVILDSPLKDKECNHELCNAEDDTVDLTKEDPPAWNSKDPSERHEGIAIDGSMATADEGNGMEAERDERKVDEMVAKEESNDVLVSTSHHRLRSSFYKARQENVDIQMRILLALSIAGSYPPSYDVYRPGIGRSAKSITEAELEEKYEVLEENEAKFLWEEAYGEAANPSPSGKSPLRYRNLHLLTGAVLQHWRTIEKVVRKRRGRNKRRIRVLRIVTTQDPSKRLVGIEIPSESIDSILSALLTEGGCEDIAQPKP